MEGEEMEAVRERVWDLHDKMSDAIHTLSKSHFLYSMRKQSASVHPHPHAQCFFLNHDRNTQAHHTQIHNGDSITADCDDFSQEEEVFLAETRSLNAIRNALEGLENNLHFLHTLQLQQHAERDAALMRLEESRLMLLKRLRQHHGRDLSVIKEAIAFAIDGDYAEDAHLNSNTNKGLCSDKTEKIEDITADLQNKCQIGLAYFLDLGIQFVKNTDNLQAMAGVVAKVAMVAVSMLAIFRFQQASHGTIKEDSRSKASRIQKSTRQYKNYQNKANVDNYFPINSAGERTELPGYHCFTSLDVLFGRG